MTVGEWQICDAFIRHSGEPSEDRQWGGGQVWLEVRLACGLSSSWIAAAVVASYPHPPVQFSCSPW